MTPRPTRRPSNPGEEGYVLIAVIFLVALLTISLAIALPKVTKEIQRDREIETMHRGKQYARAVRMYYKKFGAYPPNVDALVKPTNNIRFLRKKYSDPTTGKEDWKPVFLGQNKAPTAMGFFGHPLGGIGGCPPSNPLGAGSSNVAPGSSSIGGTSSTGTTGSSTDSSSNCLGTGLNTNTPTSTATGTTASTDPNAPNPSADQSAAGNGSSTTSAFGQPGQTMGGMGIIGFSPNSPKPSIMVYKTKKHYNEWEFVYDPLVEQMLAAGGGQGVGPTQLGQPGSQFGQPGSQLGQPGSSGQLSPGSSPPGSIPNGSVQPSNPSQ